MAITPNQIYFTKEQLDFLRYIKNNHDGMSDYATRQSALRLGYYSPNGSRIAGLREFVKRWKEYVEQGDYSEYGRPTKYWRV